MHTVTLNIVIRKPDTQTHSQQLVNGKSRAVIEVVSTISVLEADIWLLRLRFITGDRSDIRWDRDWQDHRLAGVIIFLILFSYLYFNIIDFRQTLFQFV